MTFPGDGMIVGKRTVSDGYTDGGIEMDDPIVYHPTKYHTFWLVAYSLKGYRYVADDDIIIP